MFNVSALLGVPTHQVPFQSVSYVVLDLETRNADETAIQAAIAAWKAPSNWKESTVENKRKEAAERIRERAALLDASPIICATIKTPRSAIILNGMDHTSPHIEGWQVIPCGDEKQLLLALRRWLNTSTINETIVVGHNVSSYDLPKVRNAYLRNLLALPGILKPAIGSTEIAATVVDTMRLYRAFSMEHHDSLFISLDTVADGLGIPKPKGVINGADVPRLYRAGQFETIMVYSAIDCEVTARAFLLMTNLAENLL
jgi:hypothetical protein